MAMGEKLFEEKGKATVIFIKEIGAEGVVLKQSFTSELKGHGRWPSGMNMGSGLVKMMPNGMARGKWHGIFTTSDGGDGGLERLRQVKEGTQLAQGRDAHLLHDHV